MMFKTVQDIISPEFNEDLAKDILRKSSGLKDVTVSNLIIRDSATNRGDSYLSTIVRITIEGTGRNGEKNDYISCPLVIKTLPKNIGRRKSFRSTDFFKTEVAFYNELWSSVLEFQKSKILKEPFTNIPICFAAVSNGENDFIALEDLNCQSFTTFKRQGKMSYDSILLIIRLFAKFHALSFAFKDQHPEKFEKLAETLEETYFSEKFRNWYMGFQKILISISRDAIKKELPESYLDKFDQLIAKDLYGLMIAISNDVKGSFSLVTQGDAWIPNFLCKYGEDNQPLEINLIDFQLARYASPVCDIAFFLYTCASYEMLETHWDDIILEYHTVFCQFLVELGSSPDIFPLDGFKEDIQKHALYGIGMSMEALPFQMMDDSETADLDTIQSEEAIPVETIWKVQPIKNTEDRRRLANIFKHAIDHDFL